MPFQCPECGNNGALHIAQRIELPPDSRSDEITLQVVRCASCSFLGIAVYQESRRGALDDDSFDHTGYRIHSDDLHALSARIRACPRPGDPQCKCSSHRSLGRRARSGRWNALERWRLGDAFPMIR